VNVRICRSGVSQVIQPRNGKPAVSAIPCPSSPNSVPAAAVNPCRWALAPGRDDKLRSRCGPLTSELNGTTAHTHLPPGARRPRWARLPAEEDLQLLSVARAGRRPVARVPYLRPDWGGT
jgi:hypothetical protein